MLVYAGTALQGYSRLTVAEQAALPDQNFYVDAVNMQDIGKQLLGKRTLMFLGAQQSGKSTDAMALGRKLRMFGYEVRLPLEIYLLYSSMHIKSLSLADPSLLYLEVHGVVRQPFCASRRWHMSALDPRQQIRASPRRWSGQRCCNVWALTGSRAWEA